MFYVLCSNIKNLMLVEMLAEQYDGKNTSLFLEHNELILINISSFTRIVELIFL